MRARTRAAGIFLFLPLLAEVGFDALVRKAGYPGTQMVPTDAAVLSLLAMRLLRKERLSHIDDFNLDPALGLFAGLNVLPDAEVPPKPPHSHVNSCVPDGAFDDDCAGVAVDTAASDGTATDVDDAGN